MTAEAPVQEAPLPDPLDTRSDILADRRTRRRGGVRRTLVALAVVALVTGGIVAISVTGARHRQATPPPSTLPGLPPVTAVTAPASAFLQRYVAPDGRVVRWDQGGDTVSEGQAYALLLSLATGDAPRFASVWHWEQTHLQRPDGLFSYRWADGSVTDASSATDADLLTAWALVRASSRFDTPAYGRAGIRVAAAILTGESVVAGGRIELVAGPWARTAPYVVNPSYLAPEAMESLAKATGNPQWAQLAVNSRALVSDLQAPDALLPPDWASLTTSGAVTPAPAPGSSASDRVAGAVSYGLDAQRTPVWMAADCVSAGSRLAGSIWPVQGGLANRGTNIAYSLGGTPQRTATNGLGLVASAAAADAAGQPATGSTLLADAVAGLHGQNYYGDAWAALGSILLDGRQLGTCPSGTPPAEPTATPGS